MELKKYYYIQIMDEKGKLRFLTESGNNSPEEKPQEFKSKEQADEIALTLCLNRQYAFVLESMYKFNSCKSCCFSKENE